MCSRSFTRFKLRFTIVPEADSGACLRRVCGGGQTMASGGRAAAPSAEFDVRDQIIACKRKLAPRLEALQRAFADVRDHIRRAVDKIRSDVAVGRAVVPALDYRD